MNAAPTRRKQFSKSAKHFPKVICTTVNFSLLSCTLGSFGNQNMFTSTGFSKFAVYSKYII